jgi:hypothetical protein
VEEQAAQPNVVPAAEPKNKEVNKSDNKPTLRDFIVGTAAALIAAFTSYTIQKMSVDQQRVQMELTLTQEREKLTQDRQKMEQDYKLKTQELEQHAKDEVNKQNAAKDDLQEKHQAWMLEHIDQVEEKNRQLAESMEGKYYKISIHNKCDETIYLAFRYVALDDSPIVEGWFSLKPGETSQVVNTRYREFEYYAYSASHKWYDESGSEYLIVEDLAFTYVVDTKFRLGWLTLPGKTAMHKFGDKTIPQDKPYGPYVDGFTCDKPK